MVRRVYDDLSVSKKYAIQKDPDSSFHAILNHPPPPIVCLAHKHQNKRNRQYVNGLGRSLEIRKWGQKSAD